MERTILAISTGTMNSGGISIVRMSGADAILIADKVFEAKNGKSLADAASHTVHYGLIKDDQKVIDEALVILMKAPNTYTRQDIVEINCHGGILVTRLVLETLLKHGAVLAEPGEFTKLAFLNGRIDLSQAEAVIDLINSGNKYALKASVGQLEGKLSTAVRGLRDDILDKIAYIEAALDDPEHYDLTDYVDYLWKNVENYVDNVEKLLATSDEGRIIKEGINTCILGKTNVGKSSLLNALAKEELAIVTDIAGTTRDAVKEQVMIDGIMLNLIDTAGIRETDDIVENIGINKAKDYARKAELVIHVLDGSKSISQEDLSIIESLKDKKVITIINKSDLDSKLDCQVLERELKDKYSLEAKVIRLSALTGQGLDELGVAIKDMFFKGHIQADEDIVIMNERHRSLLIETLESLKKVESGIREGFTEDFLTIDLMDAYEKLGLIIGQQVEDDLADRIFAKFCMGK